MSLDRALAWAAAGYAVFPVRVAQDADGRWSKRPLTANGHKDATTDPAQVRELWAHGARVAQVGVAVEASGLVVVDVDPRNGGERPDLPETHTVTTVSGGEHLYYRGATDRRSPWTGVDLKRNGFVVAYADPPRLRTLPRWSDGYLGNGSPWVDVAPSGAGRWTVEDAEGGFGEGERNDGLWWYASYLRGRVAGLTLDEAEERMAEAARVCRPPYDEDAARDMARRAFDAYEAAPEPEEEIDWAAIEAEMGSGLGSRFRLSDLVKANLPPVRWAVPGLIPEGLSLLAGPPKLGKSWFVLDLAISLAAGREFLDLDLSGGDVLYLALEDNPRRLQGRAIKLLAGTPAPERLELWTRAGKLASGLVPDLMAWIEAQAEPRLVIIDTLGRVQEASAWADAKDGGYADAVAALVDLQALAAAKGVAVVVVTHTKKGGWAQGADPLEAVLGSQGYAGTADSILVLKRERGESLGELFVTGREIEDEQTLQLTFSDQTCRWAVGGELTLEQAVLKVLREHPYKYTGSQVVGQAKRRKADVLGELDRLEGLGQAMKAVPDGGGHARWGLSIP